jgi:cytochrome oxidase Cu insertion factor (SCO1/SenC/PrrC family)
MTTNPAPLRTDAAPSFWRWLMLVLGLLVLLLAMYRALQAKNGSPSTLRKISTIPAFSLTERSGREITNRDLLGKIWVADFIYTTCPGPCPLITADMARMEQNLAGDPQVQFVTFTVDPRNDTPAVLAKYADRYKADPNRWWFLTGPEKPLYDLIQKGFYQAVLDNRDGPSEPGQFAVTHSTQFALVDARAQLLRDIQTLEREKTP